MGIPLGLGPLTTPELHVGDYVEFITESAPATPPAGRGRLYFDAAQSWPYFINDAGKVVPLGVARLSLSSVMFIGNASVGFIVVNNALVISYGEPGTKQASNTSVALPPGWAGRTLTVNVWWAPATTSAGNMQWNLELRRINNVTVIPSAATATGVITSAGPGVINQIVKASTAISLSGFSDGDAVDLAIYRLDTNAGDTFTGNALLHTMELSVVG